MIKRSMMGGCLLIGTLLFSCLSKTPNQSTELKEGPNVTKISPRILQAFEEINQRHAAMVRPAVNAGIPILKSDGPVSQTDENMVRGLSVVDPDLLRASQLQGIAAGGSTSAASGSTSATTDTTILDGNQLIGGTATLQDLGQGGADNTQGQPVSLFRIATDDTHSETLVVTLDQPIFQNLVPAPGPNNDECIVTCIVKYGSGQVQNVAEIDWSQGTTFQVEGSYLEIQARIDHVTGGGASQFTVNAFAGRGTKSRVSKLTKSIHSGALVHGGGTFSGNTPAMSTEVQFVYDSLPNALTGPITIEAFSRARRSYTRDMTLNINPLPIVGPIQAVEIVNSDAAHDINDSWLVFTIEL